MTDTNQYQEWMAQLNFIAESKLDIEHQHYQDFMVIYVQMQELSHVLRDKMTESFKYQVKQLKSKLRLESERELKRKQREELKQNTIVIPMLTNESNPELLNIVYSSKTKKLKTIKLDDKIYIIEQYSPEVETQLLKIRGDHRLNYQRDYKLTLSLENRKLVEIAP